MAKANIITTTDAAKTPPPAVDPAAISVKVCMDEVRRIAPFQATHDIRYYLNGMLIERAERGGVYIVATDGPTMGITHDPEGVIEGADRVIVCPSKQLLAAKPATRLSNIPLKLLLVNKRLSVAPDFGMECTQYETYSQAGNPIIEGNFPLWKHVLPDFSKLKQGFGNVVNSRIFQKFATAAMDKQARLYGTGVRFWQAEEGGAVAVQIELIPQFLGLGMPMRDANKPPVALKLMDPYRLEQQAAAAEKKKKAAKLLTKSAPATASEEAAA